MFTRIQAVRSCAQSARLSGLRAATRASAPTSLVGAGYMRAVARADTGSVGPLRSVSTTAARRNDAESGTSSKPTRPCPSCGAAIPYAASPCPSCGGLVTIPPGLSLHSLLALSDPVPAKNGGFDILAELATLPAHGYDLAPRSLRNEMLRRQALLHPDRQAAAGNDANLAATLSARVNRAYETLANPQKRAEYILEQFGEDTKETDHVADHDLLMEILEARETLDEATDPQEIEELRDANKARVDKLVEEIIAAFSKDPPDVARAKDLAVQLKYWVGLEMAAREKL